MSKPDHTIPTISSFNPYFNFIHRFVLY
jgi:hypothetical protein